MTACGNRLSNPAVDRTAGSHSLAAAGHRARSAYSESIETRPVTGEVV